MPLAILDIDGTLVDTNYQHALAWFRAFREQGIVLPLWRVHRHIGMGGDQLVGALTDDATEQRQGDTIRDRETSQYAQLIAEVEPMAEARELLLDLRRSGWALVLASSAKPEEANHYLDLLDARDLVDGWTTSADVAATKPRPDLVEAALACVGADGREAVMVGDSPWDIEAAARAGVVAMAVLTGGFAREELSERGAARVFEAIGELRLGLAEGLLEPSHASDPEFEHEHRT